MKFDRFLAKLFSKKVMVCVLVLLILAMLMSSCRFTEEDCMMCFFCGIVSPETCFSWCNDCFNCSDKLFLNYCGDCLDCEAVVQCHTMLSSCRFTEDDYFMCFFCGCVTPETCFSWCFDCLDCSDNICASCLENYFGCENVGQCHDIECAARLDESCVGQTTVHIFDCINEYCEDCEACQECD